MAATSHILIAEDKTSERKKVLRDLTIAAINAIPDHIAILDAKGKIIYVNKAWIEYATTNQLSDPNFGVGKFYCETCKPAVEKGEDDAIIIHGALSKILKKKSQDRFSHEYICPHPMDPTHDRWFLLQLIPFHIHSNLHVLVSHKDITTRKKLERSRLLLDAAITQSRSGVMITDTSGNILYVNHGFTVITGYKEKEVIGKNPRILRSGVVSKDLYIDLWATIISGKTWHGVLCNSRKNGELYWEEMTITPVKDHSGLATHYVAVKEDVTESRNNARLLLESQKMEGIGMIASSLAHDFSNLLLMISMSTYMAQNSDPSEINSHLENIKAVTEQGTAITRALSMVTRKTERHVVITNLKDQLTAIAPLLGLLLGKKISLHMQFDPSPTTARIDINEFNSAIINLVANSRDAIQDFGFVTIKTTKLTSISSEYAKHNLTQENYVSISVSDNGCGMPNETLEHALDPFFTTKPEGKGTGLGLAMANNFCIQHKGCINITSQEGAGTVVKIILPMA